MLEGKAKVEDLVISQVIGGPESHHLDRSNGNEDVVHRREAGVDKDRGALGQVIPDAEGGV